MNKFLIFIGVVSFLTFSLSCQVLASGGTSMVPISGGSPYVAGGSIYETPSFDAFSGVSLDSICYESGVETEPLSQFQKNDQRPDDFSPRIVLSREMKPEMLNREYWKDIH